MRATLSLLLCAATAACSGEINDRAFAVRNEQIETPPPMTPAVPQEAPSEPQPESPSQSPSQPPSEPLADAATPEPSPLTAPPMCTSGSFYVNTEAQEEDDDEPEYEVEGDPRMHPGRACITCHNTYEGPGFAVGGTVYPSAHEPDDCESPSAGGAQVVITDATGRELVLEVNEVGNFNSQPGEMIVMPIRAKVVQGGLERVMFGERMTGDCNSCHTQDGLNGAPGRIVLP